MTNEERWEYIRKCLNEPDGAPDYYPVSIYSLQPGDTAWLAKRMLARDDVLWMLARHDVDIARVKELEAQAAANAKVQVAAQKWGEARTARMRYLGSCASEKFNVQTVESVALGQEIRSAETQLYAALAAREEEA
jgi:hypothetical protein